MLLYTRVAPPKVPKRRSRAGCAYCKEKKKKCDEIRPKCSRCQETAHECIYEPVRPRQRRKRDSVTDATFDVNETLPDVASGEFNDVQRKEVPQQQGGWYDGQLPLILGRPQSSSRSWLDTCYREPEQSFYQSPISAHGFDDGEGMAVSWDSMGDAMPSPSDMSADLGCSVVDDAGSTQNEDYDEIVPRQNFGTPPYRPTMTTGANSPSLALMAPVPVRSPTFEFCAPAFNEFSQHTNRRALVDHFCNTLSHLIVFREDGGNPFQQLVLPISYNSPAVMDSLYALASAHLEFRGVENEEKSVQFHNKAIQGLARLIEQGGDANTNELLAAIMLLIYYEVLVQKGRSNIVDGHLKGAMTILTNKQHGFSDPASAFLERAFRFYDVIAALSFGTDPLSSAPGQGCYAPFPPLDSRGVSSPDGSVDTLLGMATTLWPVIHRLSNLLKMKETLESASLAGEVTKTAVLRTEFEAMASTIDVALQEWQPVLAPDCILAKSLDEVPADRVAERGTLQSILNNALAYRHSALVYLYRTIYDRPRSHPLVQRHTHLCLTHCVGTVSNTGPMSALLWPLFVSACEARDFADRDMARRAFVALDRHQGMTNIERAWCIVQEVWKRADEEELSLMGDGQGSGFAGVKDEMLGAKRRGDLWRRVSREMGVNIVFG